MGPLVVLLAVTCRIFQRQITLGVSDPLAHDPSMVFFNEGADQAQRRREVTWTISARAWLVIRNRYDREAHGSSVAARGGRTFAR